MDPVFEMYLAKTGSFNRTGVQPRARRGSLQRSRKCKSTGKLVLSIGGEQGAKEGEDAHTCQEASK